MAVRIAGRVLLVAVGLSAVGFGFVQFSEAFETLGAHRGVPVCGTAEAGAGTDCLHQESGWVTRKYAEDGDDSTSFMLTVARETAPSGDYSVSGSFYGDVKVGSVVDLKVYRGAVVRLAYRGHEAEHLNILWRVLIEAAVLIGVGTSAIAHGLAAPPARKWWVAVSMTVPTAVAVIAGSALLVSVQWPFAVNLGLSALGWLVMLAVTWSAVDYWNFRGV
ncbi:hypothetical protein [Kitasatospora sp. NPDC056531]|uniref:hypothetical protein n=1 Tax=Kitasatospora sp. NPDC056531 TaxID=3345856 RepID=UPI00367667EA